MMSPTDQSLSAALDDANVSLIAAIKVLRKNWVVIASSVLFCVGVGLLYSKMAAPVYEAIAMVEFDPNAVQPLSDKETRNIWSYWDNREYYETQYKIIASDRIMVRVAREQDLQNDASFLGLKEIPNPPPSLTDVAERLRARTTVEPVKQSRLVLVKVEDTDPKRARRLCEAIVAMYVSQNLDRAFNATSDAVTWLNGQVDHFRQELEINEGNLHAFKEKNNLPSSSITEVSNMIRMEMQAYNEALTKTRTRKQEQVARATELLRISPQNPAVMPASELLGNSFLQSLRTEYLNSEKEMGQLIAEGKGDNHPLVRKAVDKLNHVRASLVTEVGNLQEAVLRDIAITEKQEQGELALYEFAQQRAVELNMKEIEFHRLDRTREQNEKLYDLLMQRMKEADLVRMMKVNNVSLVDPPNDPRSPIRPRTSVNLGLGLLFGLLLGVVLAAVREFLDSSIKTPEDVEKKLGVTFLGLLPEIQDEKLISFSGKRRRDLRRAVKSGSSKPELIVHEKPLSGIAEAARSIRTNLMFLNPDNPYRKLLITSAAPSEGKTTVACTIATALAQGGQRVCIIDCDLRRPRLHRIFDRLGDFGVTNALVGEATIDEVAKPTAVHNLWCIPAGPIPPNAADILHSERFKKFIHEVGEKFDRVIIDSPPLVAVTDAAIISTIVDGTLFVLRAFSTSKALSRQGLRVLTDVGSKIAGTVLNAVDLNKHEYSYYYHYYYYKREGYKPRGVGDDGGVVFPT